MKRYTGQKALYEAISRSQAKAKRGNILDKLRAEPPKDKPADEPTPPSLEPVVTPEEPPHAVEQESPPLVEEPSEPVVEEPPVSAVEEPLPQAPAAVPVGEKPPEPPVVKQAEPVVSPEPPMARPEPSEPRAQRPESPVLRPLPFERIGRPVPPKPGQPLLRPKAVQWNAGRIEVSVPYHIGVAVMLALVVVVLVAFRIGQGYPGTPVRTGEPVEMSARPATQDTATGNVKTSVAQPPAVPSIGEQTPPQKAQSAASVPGDHWIVLARASREEDLTPVVKYFGENGIELLPVSLSYARQVFTERGLNVAALPSGEGYLLVTNNFYSNPEREGSEGYKVRQRIAELGPQYKAPKGCESFAPNYFRDAYPMKIR
jgi:hypothetical protein